MFDFLRKPEVPTYEQTYTVPKLTFEQLNGPKSTRKYRPGMRVWVNALRKPAVVLYGMNGGFVQIDTGHGPVLLYDEDLTPMDIAVASGETNSTHDEFFDRIMPDFKRRMIAAMSDADRKAYFKYTGEYGSNEPEE